MTDKYHNKWIMKDIATEAHIVRAQIRTFKFLSSMAHSLDNAIEMLEGIKQHPMLDLKLELLERKMLYLGMANGIGRLWRVDEYEL